MKEKFDKDFDLKSANDIIKNQNINLRKAVPQGYVFSLLFGIAWIVGYGALYYTKLSHLGYVMFATSLALATILCLIYLFVTLRGVKTKNSKYIMFWSISWWIGFIIHSFIMNSVEKQIKNLPVLLVNELSFTLGNSIALLIVSLCHLGAAAIFKNKLSGIFGIIIALTVMISSQLSSIQGSLICIIAGIIMLIISVFEIYKLKKVI